ncbi:MAG: transglycosylase domain-containing protein [bacterium]
MYHKFKFYCKKLITRLIHIRKKLIIFLVVFFVILVGAYSFFLYHTYLQLFGNVIFDRNGRIVSIVPNKFDEVAFRAEEIPDKLIQKIIQQEDQQFYYHIGFNPYRWTKALIGKLEGKKIIAVSTIPEQLVKNLLRNNNKRNVFNKVNELMGSSTLSLLFSKNEIMKMYVNSVPMGNGIIGMGTASEYYFNKNINDLNDKEMGLLLQTLKNPNSYNPNTLLKNNLDENYKIHVNNLRPAFYPELQAYCGEKKLCKTTIDKNVTNIIREQSKKITEQLWDMHGENAAIVVLDVKNKNFLALIGTPEPTLLSHGYQIDMTQEYRAIGSTVKPFIYALAFMKGAGPDTIVDDNPVELPLLSDFSLYPKNFDGKYRGRISLKEALSQSLNIPALKVMNFVGLQSFYDWFTNDVRINLIQEPRDYGSSTALGALELTPTQLAYMFTIFPQNGKLLPYKIVSDEEILLKGFTKKTMEERDVLSSSSTEAVTSILSNRFYGVEQFGVNSNLQLPIKNYSVKTGTSSNYHDSWVISYTPEVVVVVWVGNTANEPMQRITGQSGAGDLWEMVMGILMDNKYINDEEFNYMIKEQGYPKIGSVLQIMDSSIFIFPKNGDRIRIEKGQTVQLSATSGGVWYLDSQIIGSGSEISWIPTKEGNTKITFKGSGVVESLSISVKFK